MPVLNGFPFHFLSLGLFIIAGGVNAAQALDAPVRRDLSYSRQVIFELTYRNRDLIWLGDPASPTASVYLKRNARPIATDLCVSTLVKDNVSSSRRYFHEARIATKNGVRNVYALTSRREKLIGTIDEKNRFSPNEFYKHNQELLPSWPTNASSLEYDAEKNRLFFDIDIPGPLVSESLDFLPLELSQIHDTPVEGQFSIDYALSGDVSDTAKPAIVSLTLKCEGKSVTLAEASVPWVFRGETVQIGSFNNEAGTYVTEAAYRAGAARIDTSEPSVTFTVPGKFCSSLRADEASLVLVDTPALPKKEATSIERIIIDGNFDDWRNVNGVDDPRGDVVPYLEYIPDVDLLEYKVSHDDQHIYLYARVAGKVGRSHPAGGRCYFYA